MPPFVTEQIASRISGLRTSFRGRRPLSRQLRTFSHGLRTSSRGLWAFSRAVRNHLDQHLERHGGLHAGWEVARREGRPPESSSDLHCANACPPSMRQPEACTCVRHPISERGCRTSPSGETTGPEPAPGCGRWGAVFPCRCCIRPTRNKKGVWVITWDDPHPLPAFNPSRGIRHGTRDVEFTRPHVVNDHLG